MASATNRYDAWIKQVNKYLVAIGGYKITGCDLSALYAWGESASNVARLIYAN